MYWRRHITADFPGGVRNIGLRGVTHHADVAHQDVGHADHTDHSDHTDGKASHVDSTIPHADSAHSDAAAITLWRGHY